jgi:hypothetical protein
VKKLIALTTSIAGLLVLSATAGAPSAATATKPLSAHLTAVVGPLVSPGDRVEIAYQLEDEHVKAPTGSLYVRNDLRRNFTRLPLRLRHTAPVTLFGRLPARLLRGHRLYWYVVIRDPNSRRSLTVPRRSAWIVEHPIVVKLGKHQYGQTRTPDAVVARASANEVGWDIGEGGRGGPQTFNVARDGSVWLQDSFNNRLLMWNPGQPDQFARAVRLPGYAAQGDFVFGPGGTIYASAPGDRTYHSAVFQLSSTGAVLRAIRLTDKVRFRVPLPLRTGPNGALYLSVGEFDFGRPRDDYGLLPVTTPHGRSIPVAQQVNRTLWGYQPLARGLRLVSEPYVPPLSEKGPHDVRFALVDRHSRIVRAWRILSRDEMYGADPLLFSPALVGGDPVVKLGFGCPLGCPLEHLILQLGPHGTHARFSVPFSVWGDELYADLRLGPDGNLYQLATSPTTGVAIYRYSVR